MKIRPTKEWCEKSAEIEGDSEIGAGCPPTTCSPWDRLKAMCAEMGDTYPDDDQLADALIDALLSYRRMCAGLQMAVQRHRLGLGGEKIDELVIAELDRLSEEND